MYEAGKTVLRYEEHLGSAPLPPSSREIIYGPLGSESSHTSEGSQETGDSGHYSNEESNEEMSSPSSSRSSRPESLGPDDSIAVLELKQSFKVEKEVDASLLRGISEAHVVSSTCQAASC